MMTKHAIYHAKMIAGAVIVGVIIGMALNYILVPYLM